MVCLYGYWLLRPDAQPEPFQTRAWEVDPAPAERPSVHGKPVPGDGGDRRTEVKKDEHSVRLHYCTVASLRSPLASPLAKSGATMAMLPELASGFCCVATESAESMLDMYVPGSPLAP